ncbi:MAG: multicopper oxidase family protein [Terriglobales bacterium]
MRKQTASLSRRKFLRNSGMLLAGLAANRPALQQSVRLQAAPLQSAPAKTAIIAPPLLDVNSLARFVDSLPIPPVAIASGTRADRDHPATQIPYYRLAMRQIESKIHRDVKPTRFWGFGETSPGPTVETRSGQAILVEWANELPQDNFLPLDHSIHGAEADKPEVRVVTHLHGGRVPASSDGYPDDWYVPGKSALYHYPNQQEAATLWYHDHALGITRLNVYAGLIGLYIVRDDFEDALSLPQGKYEIPLILYDRSFDHDGQLYYPVSGNPRTPWVPEVFGNTILVNGKLFPYLDVEPRKYRFRVLNAANGRFFRLSLSNRQGFHQIGTDQGLLPAPLSSQHLPIAPGERADLVVDFAGHDGEQIVLASDSFAIMQFRISRKVAEDSSSLPSALRPVPRIPESAAIRTRLLTLGEVDDRAGNPTTMLLNNAHWSMPITEDPTLDSVEIWSLMNFTDDSHPIHLHLVRFQILDRRSFEAYAYYTEGKVKFIGPAVPPDPSEAGWKDTVQAHPGMVTRIIARFEGYPGRYVWHCHILEHEDNEMMRPYEVKASG